MAIIVFGRVPVLPIAPLRQHLGKHLPHYRWRIGEDDDGTAECVGPFRPHQLLLGRSDETSLFVEIRAREEPFGEPAPPHRIHLVIGRPTTDDEPVADRATLVVCATLMAGDAEGGWCQLAPGGNWLALGEIKRLLKAVIAGESLGAADGLGLPPGQADDAPAPATTEDAEHRPAANPGAVAPAETATPALPPASLRRTGGFGRKGL